MNRFFQTTLHPEAYHGKGKSPPFFEGWYFKLVDPTERHRYAIIPGLFLGMEATETHAFIQVLDGRTGQSFYQTYPVEEFRSAEGLFDVRIGANSFTATSMSLDLKLPDLALAGQVHFSHITPWPVTLRSPGIMGWYGWIPFMECYHGVVSLDHAIEGTLARNGATVDFTGGRGYIEKDWGRSFPEAWIWFQTNHFGKPGTCLTASIAIIPWLRSAFPGFIVGLWHESTLYRFTTYNSARIEAMEIADDQISCILRDKYYRLELHAMRSAGGLLHAPTPTGMGRRIGETLDARVQVRLTAQAGGTLARFEATGQHAGLEAAGDLERLRALWGSSYRK